MTQENTGARQAAIRTQILVAGAGSTGVAAALAFARAGLKVTLAGRFPPPLPGRTVALFEGKVGRRKNHVAVRIDRELVRNLATVER